VILDYDEEGRVVGVELIGIKDRAPGASLHELVFQTEFRASRSCDNGGRYMGCNADFLPYRMLSFGVDYAHCLPHPDWVAALQFRIVEVWGTASQLAVGARYVVRGTYKLSKGGPDAISLALPGGKAFGATAYLVPGGAAFETSTEIVQLNSPCPNGFGVVLGRCEHCVMTAWVTLKP
jgi:hypothetical protein